ncbi:MAG: sugar phosphate nucleotidyltransferase [Gemmatimonadaceae bacterium]|jgi:mannose-1-phosphate guanylyltransferase|nr:sugar phosphate nucleotidyltransferase [Gemmatimonadaceae bacterium]
MTGPFGALIDSPTLLAPDVQPLPALLPDVDVGPIWAVVLAGGIGSRFWPLATPQRPKPLLALVDERPLIADTLERLTPLVPADRVLIVTSADIADALHAAVPAVPRANVLVEPRPLGTAAAVAWGAHEVSRRGGPNAAFVTLHADLSVALPGAWRDDVRRAALLAQHADGIVALGARPTRTETGFGYMHPGRPLTERLGPLGEGAREVDHFIEKPTPALADTLIAEGAVWHTGICVATASVVLRELGMHTRELHHGLDALSAGDLARFAELVTSVSIERGLFERSDALVLLLTDCGWDDVGTWACLRRVRDLDDYGNGVSGHAYLVDSSGNIVHAENGTVVIYGISGTLVVSIDGLTFVTTLERARDLGPLLRAIPRDLRVEPGHR